MGLYEDDCGFIFQRKCSSTHSNKSIRPAKNVINNEDGEKSTLIPQEKEKKPLPPTRNYVQSEIKDNSSIKQIFLSQRKRRSSIGSRLTSKLRSPSIGMSISLAVPSVNVELLHRQCHPDLPEPVRALQLLVWISLLERDKIQKLLECESTILFPKYLHVHIDALVNALVTNSINTSWYLRSSATNIKDQEFLQKQPNPINESNSQCLLLMLEYQKSLKKAIEQWKNLISRLESEKLQTTRTVFINEPCLDNDNQSILQEFTNFNEDTELKLEECKSWFSKTPLMFDHFNWSMMQTLKFQNQIHDFCETIFKHIFVHYFHSKEEEDILSTKQQIEPMALLKALSATLD